MNLRWRERLSPGSEDIDRKLAQGVDLLRRDRAYRARCIEALAIEDTKVLAKGLERLSRTGSRT